MRRIALVPFLLLAACERSPTEPSVTEADRELAAVVEAGWAALVDPGELGLETLVAAAGNVEAAALLEEAGLLHAELAAAERGGDPRLALELEGYVELQWAEAAVAALGGGTVDRVVDGAESVLARVTEALDEARTRRGGAEEVGARITPQLERAAEELVLAVTARGEGRAAEAVLHGSRAAAEVRSLSPEAHARSVVATAHQLLARAKAMAGRDPSEAVAAAIERAEGHCRAARRALVAEEWRRAVREGRECGRIARAVIARLAGGTPDGDVAERAQQAVATARAYYERALEAAGDDTPPAVAEALARARALIGEAQAALEAGRYREAVRAAHESTAISRRILVALRPGGDGSDTDSDDRPDPTELRAQEAIGLAAAGLERARSLAGDEPAEEIRAALARASNLLADAREAYREGRYRLAVSKAHDSFALARRIVDALGG
jgi:tetratricopeptide (TPR) repeat protein